MFGKHILLIDFWYQNGGPDIVKKTVSHYNCRKLGDLRDQEKVIESTIPKGITIDLQIEPWALQGLIFEFFDGFGND